MTSFFLCVCCPACPEGWFGRNCSLSCKCKNGGVCDLVTGSCRCPPGVSGEQCQDGQFTSYNRQNILIYIIVMIIEFTDALNSGCPKGLYGKFCNKKCNCANNGRCHRTYGACLCDPGLYGRFCHLCESKFAILTTLYF